MRLTAFLLLAVLLGCGEPEFREQFRGEVVGRVEATSGLFRSPPQLHVRVGDDAVGKA